MPNPPAASDKTEFVVHAVVFVAAAIVIALLSSGAYNDDDLDHFFMAASAFRHPEFFVDYWGRAGFTALYSLPAQLGWNGARFFTVVLTLITGVVTWRTAVRLGAGHPAAWGALALWQPMVLLLSFSVLTEPLAALLVAVILNRHAADRPLEVALAAGLLPTVRVELGIVTLLVAGWVVLHHPKRWRLLLLLPIPFLVWAAIGGAVHHDPLWLLNEIRTKGRPLETAGPMHYFRNLIVVTGSIGLLGLARGFWNLATGGAPRVRFAGLVWLGGFTVLTLLTWDALKFGSSVGFLRHLIVLAPAGALVMGAGFERALASNDRLRDRWTATTLILGVVVLVALGLSHRLVSDMFVVPGRDWRRFLALLPAAGLLLACLALRRYPRWAMAGLALFAAIGSLVVTRPIALSLEQEVVRRSVASLRSRGALARPLYVSHPWFYHFAHRDRWDRKTTGYTTRAELAAAPAGAIAVWENHYGWRLFGDTTLPELATDRRWTQIDEWTDPGTRFRIVAFERTE